MNVDTKHRLAMYVSEFGGTIILGSPTNGSADERTIPGYARASEMLDVEFTLLPPAQVVKGMLASIELEEANERAEFQGKLDAFEDRRARLLCLEAPKDSSL